MLQTYRNRCYRNGPCLHGTPESVSKRDEWDYYDKATRQYIYLACRLHQKYYSQGVREAEEEEQYRSGMATTMREHGDLQLHDTDGLWFTRDDPENYLWPTWPDETTDSLEAKVTASEVRTCDSCDFLCDIRDDARYLHEDGSCPYPDAVSTPHLHYWKVDEDSPCHDFLHPLLLQDIKTINKRRARIAKAKLWGYLQQPRWRHALINSGERITDVWRRNYQPVTFYFNSFATVWLYIKNLPSEIKNNPNLLKRIRDNLELSPSYKECLQHGDWERRMLANIDDRIKRLE